MERDRAPLLAILDWVDDDVERRAASIRPVQAEAVALARELVSGVAVDLEAALE